MYVREILALLVLIDNVAGQWALTKGHGKDPAVNGVLAALFWSTAALVDWLPDFRGAVQSQRLRRSLRGGLGDVTR